MKDDERRVAQLVRDPHADELLDEDVALISSGILYLNWTEVSEGRLHPFVTPSPLAEKLLNKHGRLRPMDRRLLKSHVPRQVKADIEWAKPLIQTVYR